MTRTRILHAFQQYSFHSGLSLQVIEEYAKVRYHHLWSSTQDYELVISTHLLWSDVPYKHQGLRGA
ncbi:hypothetical protein C1H46_009421 [Malus baccata]|uniref:Uncharacterized protein n=1 Tax=Malus baccata TaxID=106549 RepID=A0A540N348_MALBA|nr:hypothetical protein C1H46_009421 [Malus baccata]